MDGWKDLKAAGSSDDATAGLGKARQPKEGWEGQTYDGGGRGDRLWRKRRALGGRCDMSLSKGGLLALGWELGCR